MPVAHLHTFGGLVLTESAGSTLAGALTGSPIGAPRRKPLALLAVLAVAGERGIDRDMLAGLVWSDLDDTRARRGLAQALYSLRRDIGGAEFVSGATQLVLRPDVIGSDVAEIEALLRRVPPDGPLEPEQAEVLIALYAGPFLDGVYYPRSTSFDQWTETQRTRLERRVVAALSRLGSADAPNARAVALLEQALARIPHSTQLALRLAGMLTELGRSSEALSILAEHSAEVRRVTDGEPPADVAHAVAAIRARLQPRVAERDAEGGSTPDAALVDAPAARTPAASRAALSRPRWQRAAITIGIVAAGAAALQFVASRMGSRSVAGSVAAIEPGAVLAEFRQLRDKDRVRELDSTRVGRVLIFSPSELSGRPELRALGPAITRELYAEVGRVTPDLVDRQTVERLEREAAALHPFRPTSQELFGSMMRVARAPLGIRVTYQQQRDTIAMFLETYTLSWRWDVAGGGARIAMVPYISVRNAPYGSGTTQAFAIANRLAARQLGTWLTTMASCSAETHLTDDAAHMCWVNKEQIMQFPIELSRERQQRWETQAARRRVRDSLVRVKRDPEGKDSLLFRRLVITAVNMHRIEGLHLEEAAVRKYLKLLWERDAMVTATPRRDSVRRVSTP